MKQSFCKNLGVALMAVLALALTTSCDQITAFFDNPVGAYLEVSPDSLTLKVGETQKLQVSTISDQPVINYASSDESIATVDETGLVTAVAGGEAIITVSVAATEVYAAATKQVSVKVVKEAVDLATLTADYTVQDGDVLTGTLDGNYKITIADGATIALKDLTISGTHVNEDAYKHAGITLEGDATIILKGENTVKGFYELYPGIYVPEGSTLTIQGDGSLSASSNGWAAGIGGGYYIACGNIVIEGGTIEATGGKTGAGIGGGYGRSCGNISITGGNVTATGGNNAAGIGNGSANGGNTISGNITISGGTVTATGGKYGAGIGSSYARAGYTNSCGNITISGGTVDAIGGDYGAGIGTGAANGTTKCGDITITTGVTRVTATKGSEASNSIGKGSGSKASFGTVTIGGVEKGGISLSASPYTYDPSITYEITGSYAVEEYNASYGYVNGTYEMTVTFDENNPDKVKIYNLWAGDYTLEGTYDAATNTISVATNKSISNYPGYGEVVGRGVNDAITAYVDTITFKFDPHVGVMTSSNIEAYLPAITYHFGFFYVIMTHKQNAD